MKHLNSLLALASEPRQAIHKLPQLALGRDRSVGRASRDPVGVKGHQRHRRGLLRQFLLPVFARLARDGGVGGDGRGAKREQDADVDELLEGVQQGRCKLEQGRRKLSDLALLAEGQVARLTHLD